jgi:hypothetical protein
VDSDAVATRVEIARRVAAGFSAQDGVVATLVAGSVARGLADDLSDIELDVYWSRPPTDEERVAAVEGAGWGRVYADVDEHEWADGVSADGVKVDVSGFTISTIDHYLDAVLAGDTEPELQVRATALRDGRVLSGGDVIETWRRRVEVYPEALAVAMVEQGLSLRSRERLEMLAARDDVVLLHRDLVDGVQGVLDALFGVNRVWCPHPFHKWLDWEATLLPTKPDGLVVRIRRLLVSPPGEGMELVCALAEETFDLAERLVPAYDAASARTAFEFRRAT